MLLLATQYKSVNYRNYSFKSYLEDTVIRTPSVLRLPMSYLFYGKVYGQTARLVQGQFPNRNSFASIIEVNWVEDLDVVKITIKYWLDWRLLIIPLLLFSGGLYISILNGDILPTVLVGILSLLICSLFYKLSKASISTTSAMLDDLFSHY